MTNFSSRTLIIIKNTICNYSKKLVIVFTILLMVSTSMEVFTMNLNNEFLFAPKICGNGIDDDGDGLIDAADSDCNGSCNGCGTPNCNSCLLYTSDAADE